MSVQRLVSSRVPGRWTTVSTVLLACFVAQSFGRFSFGLLLPAMKRDLEISYGLAGWLGTINLAGYLVGTIATSIASLRIGAHRLVQIGTTTSCVGIGLLGFADSTPVLLTGMLIAGLGGAATWVPAPALAASVFPPERRGFAVGLTSGGIGAGIVLAVILTNSVRSIADDTDLWRPIWMIEGAIAVVSVAASIAFLRPVTAMPGSPPKISVLRQVPRWWSPTFAYICFGVGYVLFTTFVVAALEQDAGFDAAHASRVFAFLGFGNAVGGFVVGRLSDVFGRGPTMAGSFFLAGICSWAVIHSREPFVSVLTFCFGMAMSGAVVSIAAYVGDHVRPQDFSAAFGVVTAAFAVAQTIGPRLGGAMADRAGNFTGVFTLAAIAWACGGLLALAMPRRPNR